MTIPDGYAQITHVFDGVVVPRGAAIVYGVNLPPALSPADVGQLAAASFGLNVMPRLNDNLGMHLTKVKFGPDEDGPSADVTQEGFIGGVLAEAATPAVSYLVIKNTASGGRRGKGRIFLPGVTENTVDFQGTVGAGTMVGLGAALDEWLTDMNGQGIPMVILHGPKTQWQLVNGKPRRVPVAGVIPLPYIVTSLAPSNIVATQRRRQR